MILLTITLFILLLYSFLNISKVPTITHFYIIGRFGFTIQDNILVIKSNINFLSFDNLFFIKGSFYYNYNPRIWLKGVSYSSIILLIFIYET